jgi:hypothetical protein
MKDRVLILPASGLAERLGGLPKFLLPDENGDSLLLRHVQGSGLAASDIVVVTRGVMFPFLEQHLKGRANLLVADTQSMSETVLASLAHHPAKRIAVGLPDTLVFPPINYNAMLSALELLGLDAAVAAFPTRPDQRGKLGGLFLQGSSIVEVVDKDPESNSILHWGAIAFDYRSLSGHIMSTDPHVGYALKAMVAGGLRCDVVSTGTQYFDMGTPSEVMMAYTHLQRTTRADA